jgi:hypothetical protein
MVSIGQSYFQRVEQHDVFKALQCGDATECLALLARENIIIQISSVPLSRNWGITLEAGDQSMDRPFITACTRP